MHMREFLGSYPLPYLSQSTYEHNCWQMLWTCEELSETDAEIAYSKYLRVNTPGDCHKLYPRFLVGSNLNIVRLAVPTDTYFSADCTSNFWYRKHCHFTYTVYSHVLWRQFQSIWIRSLSQRRDLLFLELHENKLNYRRKERGGEREEKKEKRKEKRKDKGRRGRIRLGQPSHFNDFQISINSCFTMTGPYNGFLKIQKLPPD